MTNEADKFWQEIQKKLARQAGYASLNPEEAQSEFEELPDTKLSDSEIDSIIGEVTSGQLTDWTPTPIDEQILSVESEVIGEDVYQLNRNAGEPDAETDELLNKLRRKALEDEPSDEQENEIGIDGDSEPPGEGN